MNTIEDESDVGVYISPLPLCNRLCACGFSELLMAWGVAAAWLVQELVMHANGPIIAVG